MAAAMPDDTSAVRTAGRFAELESEKKRMRTGAITPKAGRPAGEEGMVNCPLCDATMDVDEEELDEGDALVCEECGANLSVSSVSPLELTADSDDLDDFEDDEDLDEDYEDEDDEEEEDEEDEEDE